jgi:hypothetical protein
LRINQPPGPPSPKLKGGVNVPPSAA